MVCIREYKGAKGQRYRAVLKVQGRQYTKAVATKREANEWAAKKLISLKNQSRQPREEETPGSFVQLANEYLDHCFTRMRPHTVQRKARAYRLLTASIGSDFILSDLPTAQAQDFAVEVARGRGSKSANEALKELRALWSWCITRGTAKVNPWKQVTPFPAEEADRYVPPAQDVVAVLLAASPWERDILNTIIKTAARVSEVMRLRWDDVNLERGAIRLWTRKRKGGGRQSRILPLPPGLAEIMARRWAERGESQYVFTNPTTGGRLQRLQHCVRYMLPRLCERAQVRSFGFHALRHYTSMRLLDSGKATLGDIQRILGHQRATTTDTYLRKVSPDLRHLESVLDENLDERVQIEGANFDEGKK